MKVKADSDGSFKVGLREEETAAALFPCADIELFDLDQGLFFFGDEIIEDDEGGFRDFEFFIKIG